MFLITPTINTSRQPKKHVDNHEGRRDGLSRGCGSMCMVVPTIIYVQVANKHVDTHEGWRDGLSRECGSMCMVIGITHD